VDAAAVGLAAGRDTVALEVMMTKRRKMTQPAEEATFERLKAELKEAFSATNSAYHRLSAEDVIRSNALRGKAQHTSGF